MGHGLDAIDGGDGADEDSAGFAGEMGGCVEAVVHAVDEVDVGAAGWAEEGEVVGGEAAVGVGGGVGEAEVGLDLDDASGEALAVEIADEKFAEEGSGDDFGGAGVEGFWEEFGGVTDRWAHSCFALTSYFLTTSANSRVLYCYICLDSHKLSMEAT